MSDPLKPVIHDQAREEQMSYSELREKYRADNLARIRARLKDHYVLLGRLRDDPENMGHPTALHIADYLRVHDPTACAFVCEVLNREWGGNLTLVKTGMQVDNTPWNNDRPPNLIYNESRDVVGAEFDIPNSPDLQKELVDLERDGELMKKHLGVTYPDQAGKCGTYHDRIAINDLNDEQQIFDAIDSVIKDSDSQHKKEEKPK